MGNSVNMGRERLKYICAVTIYGTIGAVLRYCDLPSEIVVLFRGIIGSSMIYMFVRAQGRKPDFAAMRGKMKFLVLSGIMLGLNWVFLFAAYLKTTVAIASLLNYMAPIIVLLVSPFVLHTKMTAKKMICVLVAFFGIVLVSGVLTGPIPEIPGGNHPQGMFFGFLAALGFVGIVLCNQKTSEINAFDKCIVQLGVSALTVLPYAVLHNVGKTLTVNPRSIFILIILGVVHTGIAYSMYFGPMGVLPVQTVAICGYIEPVVSVLSSALFLREPMTIFGVIGAVCIIGAALVSELPEKQKATA